VTDDGEKLVTPEMIEAGIAASDRLALGCASVKEQCRAIYTAMHQARTVSKKERVARPIPADDAVERVARAISSTLTVAVWEEVDDTLVGEVGGIREAATAALEAIGYSALRKRVEELECQKLVLEQFAEAANARIAELESAALHHPGVSGD
jgi:hypothetical protein